MASTRNKNTPGDYAAQQTINQGGDDYYAYSKSSFYGVPTNTYFAGDGLVGMKAPHRNLSQNYSDVESYLYGIGSTNLVSPKPDPTPDIYACKSLNIFVKPEVQVPAALVPQADQRRLYLN